MACMKVAVVPLLTRAPLDKPSLFRPHGHAFDVIERCSSVPGSVPKQDRNIKLGRKNSFRTRET